MNIKHNICNPTYPQAWVGHEQDNACSNHHIIAWDLDSKQLHNKSQKPWGFHVAPPSS